jgi:hypothetical protein
MARLAVLSDFLANCPRAGVDWQQYFASYRANRKCGKGECRPCIEAITLPPQP